MHPGKSTNIATSSKDWEQLISLLDVDKFEKIQLNECNICADGCDEWITVKQGNYKHTIRYGSIENIKLKEIKPFIEKLHAIRAVHKTS